MTLIGNRDKPVLGQLKSIIFKRSTRKKWRFVTNQSNDVIKMIIGTFGTNIEKISIIELLVEVHILKSVIYH